MSLIKTKLHVFHCTFQVTQLDMTMKEHKSELQQKVITLEHALNQARYELSERAVEVINPEDMRHFLQLCSLKLLLPVNYLLEMSLESFGCNQKTFSVIHNY